MPDPGASQEYRRRICRAIDDVKPNLAEGPLVAEIAKAAFFSPFHFQRLFRARKGFIDVSRDQKFELPATIVRIHILVPITKDPEQDDRPMGVMKEVFSDYDVVGVDGRILGEGGGGIHCITQQVPAV